jgi:hypothetical protein
MAAVLMNSSNPSQLGASDPGKRFIFNKGTSKVSTTF